MATMCLAAARRFAREPAPSPKWSHPLQPPIAAGWGEENIRATFNVVDFGAVGDGVANDTLPFRAAFAACEKTRGVAGRCEVLVPAGSYVVAGLDLVSNLVLKLVGSLLGPLTASAWLSPSSGFRIHSMLNVTGLANVSILGPRTSAPGVDHLPDGSLSVTGEPDQLGGTLDGRARELWFAQCKRVDSFCYGSGRGSGLVLYVADSENVHVRGVQVVWGSVFPVQFRATSLLVENFGVLMPFVATRYNAYNVAGVGINNMAPIGYLGPLMHLRNVTVACGDDMFEVTGSRETPTSNVLIEDSCRQPTIESWTTTPAAGLNPGPPRQQQD